MREFNLSHAVSSLSTFTGSLNSLWGLYIAASFAAAGFGASKTANFPPHMAALLTVAYLGFAAAHLHALLTNLKSQKAISEEIIDRLQAAPEPLTDYPRSLAATVRIALSPKASLRVHLLIDACVVAIIWASSLYPSN